MVPGFELWIFLTNMKGHCQSLFYFCLFSTFHIWSTFCKFYLWLDSNVVLQVFEVTSLPILLQPGQGILWNNHFCFRKDFSAFLKWFLILRPCPHVEKFNTAIWWQMDKAMFFRKQHCFLLQRLGGRAKACNFYLLRITQIDEFGNESRKNIFVPLIQ